MIQKRHRITSIGFHRLMRLILQNSKSTSVLLKDDLEALKLYIEMESLRFDNLFDYKVTMDKSIKLNKIYIPPMLMQPYVENAIWHGLMQKKGRKRKPKTQPYKKKTATLSVRSKTME